MGKIVTVTYTDEEFRQIIREEVAAVIQLALNSTPEVVKVEIQEQQFMDINDTAAFLNMKVGSLYNLVNQEKIPYFKAGRSVRFNKAQLIEWMSTDKRNKPVELPKDIQ